MNYEIKVGMDLGEPIIYRRLFYDIAGLTEHCEHMMVHGVWDSDTLWAPHRILSVTATALYERNEK